MDETVHCSSPRLPAIRDTTNWFRRNDWIIEVFPRRETNAKRDELSPDHVLQAIGGTLPYGMLLIDTSLRVVFSNSMAQSLLGRKYDPLIEDSAAEVIPCELGDSECDKSQTSSIIQLQGKLIEVSFWPAAVKTGD
jgi:PAS domain-containing protein